jgi:ribose transport system substrate-binding protein
MDDLRRRFAALDSVPVPDLWGEIERRADPLGTAQETSRTIAGRPAWRSSRDASVAPARWLPVRRVVPRLLAAALAIVLVGVAIGVGSGLLRRGVLLPPPSPTPSASPPPSAATAYTIGYSNGSSVGNGFREEQLCTAKAQALVSGRVSSMAVFNRDTDAVGQLQDIGDLVARGVDAIVFNPNSATALTPALEEAHRAGIVTVSIDQSVADPNTYAVYNDQVQHAYLGARWLFDRLGGTGGVYYVRGLEGAQADIDRDTGFKQALAEYPGITVLPDENGVFTGWDPDTATAAFEAWIASGGYDRTEGVWTSGMDQPLVEIIKAAGKPFVPIVGQDGSGFVDELLDPIGYPGLVGAAVTNTAAVGGAGVQLALNLLDQRPEVPAPSSGTAYVVLLKPIIADNVTDAGKATLRSWLSVPGLSRFWPLGISIDGWTSYTPAQAAACLGPGD